MRTFWLCCTLTGCAGSRRAPYADGLYEEPVFYPLAEAKTIDDLDRYR